MLNYTRKGKEIWLMSLCKTFYFLIKIFKWRIDLRQFFIFFPLISNLWWLFLSSQTFMLKMQNEKTFMGVSCFYIWWCTSHVKKIITNTFFFFIYIYIKYNAIKFTELLICFIDTSSRLHISDFQPRGEEDKNWGSW